MATMPIRGRKANSVIRVDAEEDDDHPKANSPEPAISGHPGGVFDLVRVIRSS